MTAKPLIPVCLCIYLVLIAVSSPAAHAQLAIYLDFDGYQGYWTDYTGPNQIAYRYLNVPAFTGTQSEIDDIEARVVEDFAPFDVTVTVGEPADSDQSADDALVAVVGGDYHDFQSPNPVYGESSHPYYENTVLVAEDDPSGMRNTLKSIAATVSHELGHVLGVMSHHSLSHYTLPEHYQVPGVAPIMGNSRGYPDRRDLWFKHERVGVIDLNGNVIYRPQDDIASIEAAVGLRPDDHADSVVFATRLMFNNSNELSAEGIVEMNAASDSFYCKAEHLLNPRLGPFGSVCLNRIFRPLYWSYKDFFTFEAGWGPGGQQQIYVRVDTVNERLGKPLNDPTANLDVDIELWFQDPNNGWHAVDPAEYLRTDSAGDLWAGLSFRINARSGMRPGSYAVAVISAGGYDDLGQYSIRVSGDDISEAEWVFGVQEWLIYFMEQLRELEDKSISAMLRAMAEVQLIRPEAAKDEKMVDEIRMALVKYPPREVFTGIFQGEGWRELPDEDREGILDRFDEVVAQFAGKAS